MVDSAQKLASATIFTWTQRSSVSGKRFSDVGNIFLQTFQLYTESQRKEGYTFDDYKKNVRLAFQKAKNRVYKAVSEQRRLKKLKIGANDSKEEDNDIIKSNEIE